MARGDWPAVLRAVNERMLALGLPQVGLPEDHLRHLAYGGDHPSEQPTAPSEAGDLARMRAEVDELRKRVESIEDRLDS